MAASPRPPLMDRPRTSVSTPRKSLEMLSPQKSLAFGGDLSAGLEVLEPYLGAEEALMPGDEIIHKLRLNVKEERMTRLDLQQPFSHFDVRNVGTVSIPHAVTALASMGMRRFGFVKVFFLSLSV